MFDWIIVGLIVAVAASLLGRSIYRNVSGTKPTCACGHVECPLAGQCEHDLEASGDLPDECPLHDGDDPSRTPTGASFNSS